MLHAQFIFALGEMLCIAKSSPISKLKTPKAETGASLESNLANQPREPTGKSHDRMTKKTGTRPDLFLVARQAC